MKPNYKVIIYTSQEFNHASYIQTGLFELQQKGLVRVKVKLDIKKKLGRTIVSNKGAVTRTLHPHPKTSFYKLIDNNTKRHIVFAVDLYDLADQFSTHALETCDVVFKRNYETKYVSSLPSNYKKKMYKLGLTFGVRSNFCQQLFTIFIGGLLGSMHANLKFDRFLVHRLLRVYKVQIREWKFVRRSRSITSFEQFERSNTNAVLFQTRCFPHENYDDTKDIHKQRYDIIRILKKEFPNSFKGGFVPSRISLEKYGDAVTTVPTRPDLYLDAVKEAKIVIYTRGLANSPAWKMAEYLSQGKVIIAEYLTAELPIPLEHGKHLLYFNDYEEMTNNIHWVLNDVELMERLSKNARGYFEKYVHPVANVERILNILSIKLSQ
ncbi:glycosyltransferase [Aestuariivivens sp. NBU2969]|uniref:glycosyltransferase n=1 Tax=Aestuariivivens sp. NBU2969 TaxID=2873267 RepID=UPI001CBFF378|nr:hypothetical protein [Aestuariivivens sp. NBU2969]